MPNRNGDDVLVKENIAHLEWFSKKPEDTDDDLLKELLHNAIDLLMSAGVDEICGVEYHM